jgi:formamidopyrimidine-DNA glycosylase
MPELPEVQTVVDGLRKAVLGLSVTVQEIPPHRMVKTVVPYDLTPFRITSIDRLGKYIRLDTDRSWTIVLHLGMSGKITISDPVPPPRHLRLRWELNDGRELHFVDPRGFGRIAFHVRGTIIPELASLGVDPLSDEFTGKVLHSLLARRRSPIRNLLLDQSLIAGVGNIYACEALFRAGIRPDITGAELSPRRAARLADALREVLAEAVAANGTSISDFRRIDDKTGEFQNFLRIYGKKTCRCGAPVERLILANRSAWYCPQCQKGKGK